MKLLLNMFVILLLCSGTWSASVNGNEDTKENKTRKLEFKFEAPVELLANGKAIKGTGYPSPTLYDVDSDGKLDLVVGDIFGNIHISKKSSESSLSKWDAINKLEFDGEPIKLNNW